MNHACATAEAALVFTVFAAVYSALPWFALRRVLRGHSWSTQLLLVTSLGLGSQAILGFLWNHGVHRAPHWEAGLYVLLWAVVMAWPGRRGAEVATKPQSIGTGRRDTLALLLILTAGTLLRAIHPVEHMGLGQSDAYIHLDSLRRVVAEGVLPNQVYPPGYAWVLALPTMLFHLDPYAVARFGGAFFGAATVLAVFDISRRGWGTAGGLISAFLVACFPAFVLLQKTAVGCFANQFGLLFLPVIYGQFMGWTRSGAGWSIELALLSGALLALAVSVPMMLLSAVILCGSAYILGAVRSGALIRGLLLLAVGVAPAVAALSWHVGRLHPHHRTVTVNIIASPVARPQGNEAPSAQDRRPTDQSPSAAMRAAADFLSVKRWGYGAPAVNAVALLLMATFASALIRGMLCRSAFLLFLGVWGLLSSVQSATGWLQFTGYQREGWSLMLAVAVFGGVGAVIALPGVVRPFARPVVWTMVAAATAWSFLHPPAHRFSLSEAEDEIVGVARSLAGARWAVSSDQVRALKVALDNEPSWVLVSRIFTGFAGAQGIPFTAVLDAPAVDHVVTVGADADLSVVFNAHRICVVLLDSEVDSKASKGLVPGWHQQQYDDFRALRRGFLNINESIQRAVEGLDRTRFDVRWLQENGALRIAVVAQRADDPI